jgi:pyruvate/2-oxoglutarate dehydrogenase complex dihydrolipoamide acyltransferase (E2) component
LARVELRLPHHLESGSEPATVNSVLHGAGEPVRKGEPVLELLNSYGIFDLVAPVTGIILEVSVRSGDVVKPGAPLLVIESGDKTDSVAGSGGGKAAGPEKRRE